MFDLFPVFFFAAGALRGVQDAAITGVVTGEGHVEFVLRCSLFKFPVQGAVVIDAGSDVPLGGFQFAELRVLFCDFIEGGRHDLHQALGTDVAFSIVRETGLGDRLCLEPVPVEQRPEVAFAVFPEMAVVLVCPFAGVYRVVDEAGVRALCI